MLKAKDESEILGLMNRAKDFNLPSVIIRDAGRTEIAPDSLTVFAVFGLEECVNKVTGHLNLL